MYALNITHITACRLTEEALMRHIASTDPSLGRAAASALVRAWFLTSLPSSAPGSAATGRAAKHGSEAAAMLEAGGNKLSEEERLLANDRCAPPRSFRALSFNT